MRNQNAYLTDRMQEQQRQQRWDAFCQSGSIADYLQYRGSCQKEVTAYADASDRQGTGHSGNAVS